MSNATRIEQFQATDIHGQDVDFAQFKGKVLLIVNVASRCGFTGQYEGLQALYERYQDQGLVVMGFPCNQFGHQEPEGEDAILHFCQSRYQVTFPMFAKVDVNGEDAPLLYQWLKSSQPGLLGTQAIKWNFTKFLVGRDGQVIKRFAPQDSPASLAKDIEAALRAPITSGSFF